MRTFVIVAMLAVTAHCTGCADIFKSGGPLLDDLRNDKVHLEKLRNATDSDVYLATYGVDERIEVTWAASQDVMAWLQDTELFSTITLASRSNASDSDRSDGERYLVELPRSRGAYPITIVIDDSKRMIDIMSAADRQGTDEVTHLNITMQPFFEGSTLVTAELKVTSDFLSALKGLARIPEFLVTGHAFDKWLYEFANQLAQVHREKARAQPDLRPLDLARVHVVAIGINAPADRAAMATFKVAPLAYAEADARAFYEWATTAFPWPADDDSVIRQQLIGRDATATNVQKVLNELKEICLGGSVRDGDTVLFFFSGQIRPLRNDQASMGSNRSVIQPHLLTVDAKWDQVALTTIPRAAVLDALRLTRAARCLLFVDSCFGGGWRVGSAAQLEPYSGLAPSSQFRERIGATTALFAAEWTNQRCAEDASVQHGLFTHALLKGLENSDISVKELASYVQKSVEDRTESWQQPLFYVPDGYPVDTPIFGNAPPPSP